MADYDYDFAWSSVFPRRVSKMNRLHIVLLLVLCSGLSACYSPETRRTRGGGPGADVGNRRRVVKYT